MATLYCHTSCGVHSAVMADKGLDFDDYRSVYKDILRHAFLVDDDIAKLSIHISDPTYKSAMDQVFREVLLEYLEKEQELLERYVTFCIKCCRKGITNTSMPVVLLGDMFDSFTLDKCEKMFTFVENGVNIWKEDLFFSTCKNNLLRMCNDLLRRLSRSQNTIFCGRILLFLAKFFPISERSGLNIVSEFNLENITELGSESNLDFKESYEDDDMIEHSKKNSITIDYNLYCKFWALQEYFRNPNLCYNKVQWKTFVSHSTSVLSAFSSYKLEAVHLKNESINKCRASNSMDVDSKDDKEMHYFAKFLTNQKLLELQLSDSNFRRCILVQFLILFQYLQSTVKFKLDTFELKAEQSDWVKDTSKMIYNLIAETPPDGINFANHVKHILNREELWNTWKNNGCKEFQELKPSKSPEPSNTEDIKKLLKPRRKRLLGDIIKDYESQGKYYLGNNELTKLWNLCPDNLESCKGKDRDFLPSLEIYLSEAIDQAEKDVKGDKRIVADGNFGWRALRLLANRSPHFFSFTNNIISSLPDYLETMVKKCAKDFADSKQIGQDVEVEISEEQMVAELIKEGDPNDVEQVQDTEAQSSDNREYYDESQRSSPKQISDEQLNELSERLQGNWEKLATKLGFKDDEILYFTQENSTNSLRAKNMLQIYFQDDEDASSENLAYILEGLNFFEAASILKEVEN